MPIPLLKDPLAGLTYEEYNIDAQGRYVGGISKVYRKFGLRQDDPLNARIFSGDTVLVGAYLFA